jgi:hypothetical protein
VILLRILYLIAPLIVAGAVHGPIIKRNLAPALARPLDSGRTFRGLPIFGANKTWRGVLVMSSACVLTTFAQHTLYGRPAFRALSIVDYRFPTWLTLGLALGLAYSLSELPNSFLKRRLRIPPGGVSTHRAAVQYICDQADSAVGGTLALVPFVDGDVAVLLLTFSVGVGLHIAMDRLFYLVGVKRVQEAAA